MKLKCNRHHKYFRSFGHFLDTFKLNSKSSPEITAYDAFVKAKRLQCGWTRYERYSGLEKHHIVPTSYGGRNEPTNYVNMTTDEHMYAHRLFGLAIRSRGKAFGIKLVNKTQCTMPSMKVVIKELLKPTSILLLEMK